MVRNLPAMQDTQVGSLGWEDSPWRRKWQSIPVFLPRESHGQRSLAVYSPWGRKSQTGLSDLARIHAPEESDFNIIKHQWQNHKYF